MNEHLTEKEIKVLNKEIKVLWDKIVYKIDNCSCSKYATQLFNICKKESKEHDNFRDASIKRGLTIIEESRFFALQNVLNYLYDEVKKPDIDGFISYKKSIFYGYSITKTFKEKLKKVISEETANKFIKLDYCTLI